MKQAKSVLYDGVKAINAWDVDSDVGWTSMTDPTANKQDEFYRSVPWLYRGVRDRSNYVGRMPFTIYKGDKEVDSSKTYNNVIDCMPNPGALFKKIEMSITMTGVAYVMLVKNKNGYIKDLKYMVTSTIDEIRDKQTGALTGYKRNIGAGEIKMPVEDVLAFYDTDYQVEIGKPLSSPAKAALTSAGVLYNTDVFVASFFKRGAIKATVLTTIGFSEDHALRLQKWWNDVIAGIKNAWSALVLRGESVNATVIGEGVESLTNTELTTERRQNIATALGIPESRLWSSAANYATADQDNKNYINSTIIPECEIIAETLNDQLFTAENKLEGYKINFDYETLDAFKKSIADMAAAAQSLINTGMPALMAYDKVGIELTEEERAEIMGQGEPDDEPGETEAEPMQDEPDDEMQDLERWQRKAIKAYKNGRSPDVKFVSEHIDSMKANVISEMLSTANSIDDVKAAFEIGGKQEIDVAKHIDKLLGALNG